MNLWLLQTSSLPFMTHCGLLMQSCRNKVWKSSGTIKCTCVCFFVCVCVCTSYFSQQRHQDVLLLIHLHFDFNIIVALIRRQRIEKHSDAEELRVETFSLAQEIVDLREQRERISSERSRYMWQLHRRCETPYDSIEYITW